MTQPKAMRRRIGEALVAVLVPLGAVAALAASAPPAYEWNLPNGFPTPRVPADNPMTRQKVTLGWYLFYDMRLSANQTQSCASCHRCEN